MTVTRAQRLALFALSAAIVGLYSWRLATDPVYLSRDEVLVAIEAETMARTWHGSDGRFLPFYVYLGPNSWASPIRMYVSALAFRVGHISDGLSRVPSVLGGVAAIALMFVWARRVFHNAWYGMLGALLLGLMPAEFLASRFKIESHYPLAFVAGWMWCLQRYQEHRATRWLVAAGAILGAGIYSYHAAPIMMPVYVGLTLWFVWRLDGLAPGRVLALGGAFAALAVPYAVFALTHPAYVRGELTSYRFVDGGSAQRLVDAISLFEWTAFTERLNAYWQYFSPSLLFFSGGSDYYETTRRAGAMLVALAIFLPVGVYRVLTIEPRPARIHVIGLMIGPLAGSLVLGDGSVMRRALFMLPFAAILAVYGVRHLVESTRRWPRVAAIALLVTVPLQFADFYIDYFGDYRIRSWYWLKGNMRDAFEGAIALEPKAPQAQPVYISTGINAEVDRYWMFYLLKHDRTDLAAKTIIFEPDSATNETFPSGAIIVTTAAAARPLSAAITGLTERRQIREPDGSISFYVWTKETPGPGDR